MKQSFSYQNTWYRFLIYFVLVVLSEIPLLFALFQVGFALEIRSLLLFILININSMLCMAFSLLAYIHYKSPHYRINLFEDSITVPKKSIIPDSHIIYFSDVIFEGIEFHQGEEKYKLVFAANSVALSKRFFRSDADWNELLFRMKEALTQ